MKIAMWSGPRNLSTAMMYAFGNRVDCAVSDEPFYASYLHQTDLTHPMQAEILAGQPTNPNGVIQDITGPNPNGSPIWYQKHMTHHMLPGVPIDWINGFQNVFLIRHPARVIASYAKKREAPTLDDLGFEAQHRIFEHCIALGQNPIVVDSDAILQNPREKMTSLCNALGITFSEDMLSWQPGPRSEDGVWAAHWYDSVHKSTGFGDPPGALPVLADQYLPMLEVSLEIYKSLKSKEI